MSTQPPPTSLHEARRQIRINHLEQLSNANLTLDPPSDDASSPLQSICPNLKEKLMKWSQTRIKSIQSAIKNGAISGKETINWDYCFLAFMESMTVYLRDWKKLYAAVQQYKRVKAGALSNGDLGMVLDMYGESEADIKEVAAIWGMDFMQICDLTTAQNDVNPKWNGPFCGAFFPKDHQKGASCVGISFKGTDKNNHSDINVDQSFEPIQAEATRLFGTKVSQGVYNAMFGKFNDKDAIPPFDRVLEALKTFVPTMQGSANDEVPFHVTGHSLGGSYSTFCFAQCMMANAANGLPAGVQLGDLYNFGSPRVGQQSWSKAFYDNLSNGKFPGGAWRIVNDQDIVPQVPSLLKYLDDTGPFWHIDYGIKIFENSKPQPIPSERDGDGNKDIGIGKDAFILKLATQKFHFPPSYYQAMAYALDNP